jgi:TPP-dependent pyruvate/acetoin dehydrogenase alpha subunit
MTGRHQATAAQRTELLHRMLVLRRGEQQGAHLGEEAITVGMSCALGPADTLADGPVLAVELAQDDVLRHRPAVTVCFFGDDSAPGLAGTLGHAIDDRLPVLFCCADQHEHHPAGCEALPAQIVDGTDVEAVARAALTAVHPVRAGDGPRLLHFRTYEPAAGPLHDPIRILVERMRTDHQLDDNAYAAIEKHVAVAIGARRRH